VTNKAIRTYAEELSNLMMQIEDLKVEAKAVVDKAKDEGINTKALKKVAKELCTDPTKLAAKYEDEEQLEMFRDELNIRARKGLVREAA